MDIHPFVALTFYLAFLASVTLHEAAHAWVAWRGGDDVAYLGGQVSLDPRPHIRREPFGMVVLPLLTLGAMGFPLGYASTPYSLDWARRHPRRAAWMALAGPGANLLLAAVAGLLLALLLQVGFFTAPALIDFGQLVQGPEGWGTGLGIVLSVMFSLNLLLLLFNLIPLPPMDGAGALPLVLSPAASRRYQELTERGPAALVGLLLAWLIFPVIWHPVFLFAANLLHTKAHYG